MKPAKATGISRDHPVPVGSLNGRFSQELTGPRASLTIWSKLKLRRNLFDTPKCSEVQLSLTCQHHHRKSGMSLFQRLQLQHCEVV